MSMDVRSYKSVKERRLALEKEYQVDLENIGSFTFDESIVSTRNCENLIGVSQIPLGIAGPLKTNYSSSGAKAESRSNNSRQVEDAPRGTRTVSYYIPLATTEGALVASISRGCKAVTQSGGTSVFVESVGMTRGPVFKAKNLSDAMSAEIWIQEHFQDLARTAESTSIHLKLLKADYKVVGRNLFVRFSFDTQDAMGMNMVTIATAEIVKQIEEKTKATCVSLAGNFDIDKKPAWLNFINGRGKKVWAEVTLSKNVVSDVLKTTPQKIFDVWLTKSMMGSAISGSMGFNAQFANVVAAMFLATGQDPAHIVEGSMGMTTAEVLENGDLYFSIYLPSLIVGTVGGGTGLGTQKEALSILGVVGGDNGKNAKKFAEIIGGAVLAGEISLLASLAEGTLAKAHQSLGRGKIRISKSEIRNKF